MIDKLSSVIGRREWPVVVALFLPAAALWGFIELADEVAEGGTKAVDRALLLALRSPGDPAQPLGPEWLEVMMRDFTALGGVGVLTLITAATIGYLLLLGKPRAGFAVLIAVGGGILLSTAVKMGIDRPRPELVPYATYVSTASFPSGHSMMATVVYLTLAAMLARVRPRWQTKTYILSWAVLISLLVGVSRVYLGVHWPTDVLAGWTVGSAWALTCWLVTLWLQRRNGVESELG
ncbi:phosphatase PAP2 family protein [Rhodoligotrophos defluvii]|uniref:phosphatase PAP2 family protein n=1 Tax=Rhodoligotrophos defluvii TaxID=2561934 RepID=UPI001EEFD172|nr:phosphatase PAP2 family protein [Rhodoligotrophos defluvii]